MKIVLYDGNWTKEEIESKNDTLFLYEDDEARTTNISFRSLKNVFPIYTRKNNKLSGKYKDKDFDDDIKQRIDDNFKMLEILISSGIYKKISLPFNGFETRLSSTPVILKYISNKIKKLTESIEEEEKRRNELEEISSWNIS